MIHAVSIANAVPDPVERTSARALVFHNAVSAVEQARLDIASFVTHQVSDSTQITAVVALFFSVRVSAAVHAVE